MLKERKYLTEVTMKTKADFENFPFGVLVFDVMCWLDKRLHHITDLWYKGHDGHG
jgi:hypothetical protein